AYTPVLFAKDPKRTVQYKSREIGRRIKELAKKAFPDKVEKKEGFAAYADDIHERSLTAQKNYHLTPANLAVELFRATKKTFYMPDFEFLGWKPYALKGVHVHDIPGEHNTIFAPPHDKLFAEILQKCLDKAAAGESTEAI
ncbi:MAG: hypothetical protein JKY70_18685, partial [Mucilaginibacter sp.]|nr:hypothetical protein [Mucilaginibacter sp.]